MLANSEIDIRIIFRGGVCVQQFFWCYDFHSNNSEVFHITFSICSTQQVFVHETAKLFLLRHLFFFARQKKKVFTTLKVGWTFGNPAFVANQISIISLGFSGEPGTNVIKLFTAVSYDFS